MDLNKFIYSDIGENILERFYNEGKGIKTIGSIDDYLSLPMNEEFLGKEETKEETKDQSKEEIKDESKDKLTDQ